MQADRADIVAITSGGPHAWITINALRDAFGPFPVLLDDGEVGSLFWRRRRKRLGILRTMGLWAAKFATRPTKRRAQARIKALVAEYDLKPEPETDQAILPIGSVNSEHARTLLRQLAPRAVYIVGTRMLDKETLAAIDVPVINYHSGINPAYRGIHGGYHALANGEPHLFGTTVHLVDQGVDTGGILYQHVVETTPQDNFHTYTWLMAAHSRAIVVQAMRDALNGTLAPYVRDDLPSNQYYGPTLWSYLWTGLKKKVW